MTRPNDSRALMESILTAPVYDVAIESALDPAPNLSRRLGHQVLLKREDLQPVFSFKLRGAYTKMARLDRAELDRGVVAASAGNHAQGVALAAQRLGCRASIVMPATTPEIKVRAVADRGAKVELFGDSYGEAYERALALAREHGATFVHAYDDPDVIAGQGTIGMELLRQRPRDLHAVFVPVGGGGLIAGIAAYIKWLKPEVKVIGVEPVDADAMYRSLQAGTRVTLEEVGLFADGVAVKRVGEATFDLCRKYVDEVLRVDGDAICAAIQDVFEDTRSILEPAGALAVAGLKQWAEREGNYGRTLVAIASGANMNFDRLRHVAERAALGEKREALLAVTIPERPGSFREFCALIGRRSVTEFNYRYADPKKAHVFVGLEVQSASEVDLLLATLEDAGLPALDLSGNELAKLHLRHLVGGHAPANHEKLFRFEFPERPGALLNFLERLRGDWNISLFHYRNHGADYGRALVGFQVPPESESQLHHLLDDIGYRRWHETYNPVYRLFLGPSSSGT
ncbi:threonine ammonia-lyase, biosynthetic [Pendulispora albinea]|uniref:L-threonine dehydratase n=1 Tax=Pendulispora albinea TaxID=2741071 RepID=A0ABZ2M8L3_9BACT